MFSNMYACNMHDSGKFKYGVKPSWEQQDRDTGLKANSIDLNINNSLNMAGLSGTAIFASFNKCFSS